MDFSNEFEGGFGNLGFFFLLLGIMRTEDGMRSGDSPGIFVKNRSSTGCLIIKKKGDGLGGAGSSGLRNVFEPKKEKKRPRLVLSDSESSDELSEPYRRKIVSRASEVRDGFEKHIVEGSGIDMKKNRLEHIKYRNGDDQSGRKRSTSNAFEYDQYEGVGGKKLRKEYIDNSEVDIRGRSFLHSEPMARGGSQRGFEPESRDHDIVYRRKHSYSSTSFVDERNKGADYSEKSRFGVKCDAPRTSVSLLRGNYGNHSEEPIRLQGKNGVLKVMLNKKKGSGLLKTYDHRGAEENMKGSRSGDTVKRNNLIRTPIYSETKPNKKADSLVRPQEIEPNLQKSFAANNSRALDSDTDDSDQPLKLGSKKEEVRKPMEVRDERERAWTPEKLLRTSGSEGKFKFASGTEKKKLREVRGERERAGTPENLLPISCNEEKVKAKKKLREAGEERVRAQAPDKFLPISFNESNVKHGSSSEKKKLHESRDERERVSCNEGRVKHGSGAEKQKHRDVRNERERAVTPEKLLPVSSNEGKVKRGSGTEKQKLREQIRGMLLDAGWTIDYRPRRNRDYQDAVYVNPSGTAYWSIIKAYDALQKQDSNFKPTGESASFTPIAEEVLSKLTRQTRKKMEEEMKRKHREDGVSKMSKKSANFKHNDRAEEKLSSSKKQGLKSSRGRINENGSVSLNREHHYSSHLSHEANHVNGDTSSGSLFAQGRKSRKLGRCTLLVRNTNKGLNSETDGYVPYTGKRTLLSWLIDTGTVELSQKVQYMNRKRTRAMLEGWITRDGIHCGCCSKILTVTKFEIHAGSKLRQPFQNIYLDSGASLLQCQIDAWNRQEESERRSFHAIDVDGDDPNDDTCGICGDGGDLICCDGCPSTFHQSCLDIQALPPGDWHCPHCTCKFCGMAGGSFARGKDITSCAPLTCNLCEKKYHQSCIQDVDVLPVDSTSPCTSFCGQKCRELFEHLQKFLGVKHELESGFSWSLIRRTDTDSDASFRGLAQRVECNSKLAVALTVMDECFLPIVDRRSGINLIHNVLYNCGSNFNRLNYGGFYTAILERGDEIISAASIRFHGTQLAEMPYIGTRHIYRRQGMCRRLFFAIESALCSFKVERLIIPAISELMHTWTGLFGFSPLEESHKQELRSINILVFPGVDMLQKLLAVQESTERNVVVSSGAKPLKLEGGHCSTPELSNKSDRDSSNGHDLHPRDDAGIPHVSKIKDEAVAFESGSHGSGGSGNETSVLSSPLDAALKLSVNKNEEVKFSKSQSVVKLPGSSMVVSSSPLDHPHEVNAPVTTKEVICSKSQSVDTVPDSATVGSTNDASVLTSPLDAPNEVKVLNSNEEALCLKSEPGDRLSGSATGGSVTRSCVLSSPLEAPRKFEVPVTDSATESKCLSLTGTSRMVLETGNEPVLDSPMEMDAEGDMHAVNASNMVLEMGNKPILDFPMESVVQSSAEDDMDVVKPVLHSSGEISSQNATMEMNDNKKVTSVFTLHGTDESILRPKIDLNGTDESIPQSNLDLNNHNSSDGECKPASNSVLGTNVSEVKRESAIESECLSSSDTNHTTGSKPVLEQIQVPHPISVEKMNDKKDASSVCTFCDTEEKVTFDLNQGEEGERENGSFVVSEQVCDANVV